MADLEALRMRSLRAYELGRVRAASRIALYMAPGLILCWLLARDRESCACLGVLLAGLAIWLRWRSRRAAEDVTLGLLAGVIPMGVGLMLGAYYTDGGFLNVAWSAAAGAAAGLAIALAERRGSSTAQSWLAAAAVAALTASVGCVSLGVLGVAAPVVGIAVGSGLGALATAGR